MIKNIKDIIVCVVDFGFFVPLAEKLTEYFNKVYYCFYLKSGYPKEMHNRVGTGIPNVIMIKDYHAYINEVDLFIFPDCYGSEDAEYLRSLGKLVWGGGASWLERDRFKTREWQKTEKMPVPETEKIIGIDNLKTIGGEKFIKISETRGSMETVKHYDNIRSEQRFDSLKVEFGAHKDLMEFMVETKINGIEVGYDGYTVDGKFPATSLFGYEIKDEGYAGKFINYDMLCEPLKYTNKKLSAVFEKENVRGFFSTEVRIDKNRKGYLIDPTMRCPNPPYQIYLENIENLGEIIYYGSQGILVNPKIKFKYGVVAIMNSAFAEKNSLAFKIKEDSEKWVKIMNMCIVGGVRYSLPIYGLDEIGAVIGLGHTLEHAITECKKHAEEVNADSLEIEIASLDKVFDTIKEGRKYGVMF